MHFLRLMNSSIGILVWLFETFLPCYEPGGGEEAINSALPFTLTQTGLMQ
jgi:hypothetical protein